ncbi:hypothetical protein ACQEVF_47830 [Nonomuraea polychroma]|uniref:hypothetical protein n=1 Tax=Nonomuraea polychroma TaxID=46176 RepID=UPI003D8A35A0
MSGLAAAASRTTAGPRLCLPAEATAELDRLRHQVLGEAQIQAAILGQARTDAEQIVASAQIIA